MNRLPSPVARAHSLRRQRFAAAALLLVLAGRAAQAQSVWTNADGGNWGVASNWNNLNVPDNAGESAIILPAGPYTIFFDNNYTVNNITIVHALARLDLQNSLSLALAGGLDTAGPLTINNSPPPFNVNGTYIRIIANQEWKGTGPVYLNANTSNLDTSYIMYNGGGEVLTLASGKSILGTGRIYVAMINNGGVIANVPGATLQILSFAKTNNSEFAALDGGILSISSTGVTQNSFGGIRAYPGSTVSIFSSNITGGKISTDAGGATQFSGSSTLTGLSTAGAIDVLNNNSVALANSLVNDGDFRVSDGSGVNGTFIRCNNSVALDGFGTITLRSTAGNADTAYLMYNGGGEVLTQGAQHTIRGSGNIYVGMVNNGTISASTAGRSLRIVSFPKTNNKTISADLGRLEIDQTTVNQGVSGVISLSSVAGASMVLRSAVINSGLLQSSVNAITIEGTSTLNATSINGPMHVLNNNEMRFAGAGTIHSGDLFVNSGAGPNNTNIRVVAPNHTISGPGRIVLRATPGNLDTAYLTYNGGGEVLTQAAGHSIVGTGNIYVALANAGLVSADQAGRTLQLLSFGKSNTGVMGSTGGGNIQVNATTVNQTGAGTLRADNAQISLINAVINGGLIETLNGGVCDVSGTTAWSGVSFAGVGRVLNNNELRLSGPLTNNGTVTINPTEGVNGTYLRLVGSYTVSGSGSIVLNAHPDNLDTAHLMYNSGGEVLTNGAAHTVRGTGRIHVALTNDGTVSANIPGRTLELTGFAKTNNAIFEASGGGTLRLSNATVNQAPGGTILSTAGGLLNFVNSIISGGTVQTDSFALADAAAISGSCTMGGVTLEGGAKILNNSELRINGAGLINNGVLTVNATTGPNNTYLRATANTLIDGSGVIVLNADPGNFDTAYLYFNGGGEQLTLGPGQTLAGRGNVYVRTVNNGVLAPGGAPDGAAIGRINLSAFPFTQGGSGVMAFQISGPTPAEFDRVTGGATLNLGGTLAPSLINGYSPVVGTFYDIIDGPPIVGTFASVTPGFSVQYFANRVRVTYTGPTCPADLNHDDVVDDADFVIFVPAYNLLDCSDPLMPPGCPADLNRDGVVDDADFVIFLAQYNELICPE